jgi:hypothetical protein
MTLRSTAVSTAARIALAATLAIGGLGMVVQGVGATVTVPAAFPLILQEVPTSDLVANTNGICNAGANLVIKNAQGTFNRVVYANAALACGLHVIWSFPDTVNYTLGRVYTSRVAALVNQVKNLPATWGYLSVKEPNWSHISGLEIRALYRAFHAADPAHKVLVLFGDIPHFGSSTNPYTRGMANVVMVDWYPVETTNGTNSIYLTGASKWFPKVRAFVAKTSPGTPVYLMVQTHKYLRPATHKKQRPTQAQLNREVRDGFTYLHASGIAFHVWRNVSYTSDELRSPTMVGWMKTLMGQISAGTFR